MVNYKDQAIDVQVTNSLHEALQRPKMLLCPVEYCSSRAVPGRSLSLFLFPSIFTLRPDVADSEYLATLGNTLHPNIKVQITLILPSRGGAISVLRNI